MAEIKYCCDKLKTAIQDETVTQYGNQVCIREKPRMVDDGDGYFDDMSDEISISYCPFCGIRLATLSVIEKWTEENGRLINWGPCSKGG